MKKFILRFCSVLTCVIVLVGSCFSTSAVSDTGAELLERGWVYDESDGSYYLPRDVYDPIAYPPMTMISPDRYFPNFDYTKIPWLSVPEHVSKYLYMPFKWDLNNYEVPFVMIRVTTSRASVFVGYNIGLGYDGSKDTYRVATPYFTSDCNSVCYYATFDSRTYKQTADWQMLSSTPWGDTGKIVSYSSNIAYSSTENDYYFYGGAGVKRGDLTSVTYSMYSNGGVCSFQCDSRVGYASGNFFWYQNHEETLPYGQYFVPPSSTFLQSQQQQELIDGQKEMNDTLESMPGEFASSFDEQISPGKQPDLDTSASDALKEAEDDLMTSNYNPDNFNNDFKINLDGKAIGAVFAMLDSVVQIDNDVYAGIIGVLVLGVIALIFNR